MTEKNAYFTGKLQSSMVPRLMFARMRQAAALGRRIEKSGRFSEPAVFVFVAKRQKNQLTFSCNIQQAHQNILGWVVPKPVNANPGLKVNRSINFSCIGMFSPAHVLCSLSLVKLKTEG